MGTYGINCGAQNTACGCDCHRGIVAPHTGPCPCAHPYTTYYTVPPPVTRAEFEALATRVHDLETVEDIRAEDADGPDAACARGIEMAAAALDRVAALEATARPSSDRLASMQCELDATQKLAAVRAVLGERRHEQRKVSTPGQYNAVWCMPCREAWPCLHERLWRAVEGEPSG